MVIGTNIFSSNVYNTNYGQGKFQQVPVQNVMVTTVPTYIVGNYPSNYMNGGDMFSTAFLPAGNRVSQGEKQKMMKINFVILSLLASFTAPGNAIGQQSPNNAIKPEQAKVVKPQESPSQNLNEEKRWWKEAVVYQIYPKSFKDSDGNGVGDLNGITQKLDYLKELGVDVIWLNPVYASPNKDNGYDISDYRNIMNEFGTMQDWDKLIAEMHKRGIRLMMDLVVNHTSDQHEWFKKATNPNDKDYEKFRNFYIWHPPTKDGQPPSVTKSAFSDSAWSKDERTGEWNLNIFHPNMKDLNWKNPQTRQAVYDMMDFWFKKGIDGFRMDVIDAVGKKDLTKLTKDDKEFFMVINGDKTDFNNCMKEMHEKVLGKYKKGGVMGRDETNEIMTVGECSWLNLDQAKEAVSSKNKELDMVFGFDHMYLDYDGKELNKWTTRKIDLTKLKEVLTKWTNALEGVGWNSIYLMNHDQPRAVSRYGNDSTEEFRKKSAELLCTMEMTQKGTPYVYMGEEIGMTNSNFENITDYRDVDTYNYYNSSKKQGIPEETIMKNIRYRSRDNARTPMQWDSSPYGGFTTGAPWIPLNKNYTKINVAEAKKDPNSIFNYYKKMIKLRKQNPTLIYGKYDLLAKDDKNIYAYTRTLGKEKMLVVLNFSDKNNKFATAPSNITTKNAKLLITNYSDRKDDSPEVLNLKPYEARVYKLS